LEKLIGLLEEETSLYGYIVSVLQQEKKAIVASELEALNETAKKKESLLLKIRILDEERTKILEKLGGFLGYPSNDMTLRKISQLVEKPHSIRLNNCYSNLLALTQTIQDLNRGNKALIVHSLEIVRDSLSILTNLLPSNPLYYQTGEIKMAEQSGKILSGRI